MLRERISILQIRDPRAYVFVDPAGKWMGESLRNITGGIEVHDEHGDTIGIHRTGFWKEQVLTDTGKDPIYSLKLLKKRVQRMQGHKDLVYEVTSEVKTRMDHRLLLSWVYFTFLEHTA